MSGGGAATLGERIRELARARPDAHAVETRGRPPLSYAGLAAHAERVREALNARGIGLGDRVGIVLPDGPALLSALVAVGDCATAAGFSRRLSAAEYETRLRSIRARAAIVGEGEEPGVREAAARLGVPVLDLALPTGAAAGVFTLSGGAVGPAVIGGRAEPDDIQLVMSTSGTTSRPKNIPLTGRVVAERARGYETVFRITATDRALGIMPLYHGHGLETSVYAPLWAGACSVLVEDLAIHDFHDSLTAFGATFFSASFAVHRALLARAAETGWRMPVRSLRYVRVGSGPMTEEEYRRIERIYRAPVAVGYSTSEAGNTCSAGTPRRPRRPGAIGVATPGLEIAIAGPDGRRLPPGRQGEIVVRGAQVMEAYDDDAELTRAAFRDGWFRTGDLGRLDEDGYLAVTGRLKDVISRGGEKISPAEIDAALIAHPAVAAAASFAIPHPVLGEEIAAAIVPVNGNAPTTAELKAHARARLSPFKVPRAFVVVDALPGSEIGRVRRGELARLFGGRIEAAGGDSPETATQAALAGIWGALLGRDDIGPRDDFFLLGGDSLMAVELFLRIEERFGRALPHAALLEASTLAEMAEILDAGEGFDCLVALRPEGREAPFFCVHDGTGEVLNYARLADLTDPDRPFYALQSVGLDGRAAALTSVPEMAERYVSAIRRVRPCGPYLIGGYSFGGRVALEIAHLLRAEGEDVPALLLVDTYAHHENKRAPLGVWLGRHARRLRRLDPREVPGYLGARVLNAGELASRALRRGFSGAGDGTAGAIRALNSRAGRAYRPRPYDGPTVYVRCEPYAWAHPDALTHWRRTFTGPLEVHDVAAQHFEVVREPHVRELARIVDDALARLSGRGLERRAAGRVAE